MCPLCALSDTFTAGDSSWSAEDHQSRLQEEWKAFAKEKYIPSVVFAAEEAHCVNPQVSVSHHTIRLI